MYETTSIALLSARCWFGYDDSLAGICCVPAKSKAATLLHPVIGHTNSTKYPPARVEYDFQTSCLLTECQLALLLSANLQTFACFQVRQLLYPAAGLDEHGQISDCRRAGSVLLRARAGPGHQLTAYTGSRQLPQQLSLTGDPSRYDFTPDHILWLVELNPSVRDRGSCRLRH